MTLPPLPEWTKMDGLGGLVPSEIRVAMRAYGAACAAAERESMIADGWRQCAKGQRTTQFCGQLEAAVAADRERITAMFDAEHEQLQRPQTAAYYARVIRAQEKL